MTRSSTTSKPPRRPHRQYYPCQLGLVVRHEFQSQWDRSHPPQPSLSSGLLRAFLQLGGFARLFLLTLGVFVLLAVIVRGAVDIVATMPLTQVLGVFWLLVAAALVSALLDIINAD
jgi:hypothetical protein